MRTRPTATTILNALHGCLRFRSRVSTLSHLREELISRPHNIVYDYLSPTSSHLLNVSLTDFLPQSCRADNLRSSDIASYGITPGDGPLTLPDGHHLVYFPPAIPSRSLLPDGTDILHSPGAPFNRRMWAGGALLFHDAQSSRPMLNCGPAACVEGIRDVSIKGREGDEKIFVHIERRIGIWDRSEELTEEEIDQRFWSPEATSIGQASLVERRDLVFMRDRNPETSLKEDRVVKSIRSPDFRVCLRVPPSLLFRFSALTFNAHAIHLDPQYAREVEGFRDLLVHGPLTLILMLSVLRSQLTRREVLASFDYRNLAPLFAHEDISICIRKDTSLGNKYHLWIESESRGLAVKGSAITKPVY